MATMDNSPHHKPFPDRLTRGLVRIGLLLGAVAPSAYLVATFPLTVLVEPPSIEGFYDYIPRKNFPDGKLITPNWEASPPYGELRPGRLMRADTALRLHEQASRTARWDLVEQGACVEVVSKWMPYGVTRSGWLRLRTVPCR